MSIKNYYGLKILDNNLFIQELIKYKKKLFDSYTLKESVQVLFNEYLNGNKFYENKNLERELNFKEINYFINQFNENKKMSVLPYQNPYDLTINFFPEHHLAIPYFENTKHYNALLNFKSVQEYAYYNNVDMPGEMTEKDWQLRKENWEQVENNYSYLNQGYKDALVIEVFKETLNYIDIIKYINDNKNEMLLKYLQDSVLNDSISLFNSEYKNISKNDIYSKIGFTEMSKQNHKYYDQFGEQYVQEILLEYLNILNNKLDM